MLDVRPVDMRAREGQVRGNRLARVIGVADDQSADDQHSVPVQDVDRIKGRVSFSATLAVPAVLRPCLEEHQILVEDVLDAEEHVAEPGLLHQWREGRAV